jgi:hypothetical protein
VSAMRGAGKWGKIVSLTLVLSLFAWSAAVPMQASADGGGAYQVESLTPAQSWFFDSLLDVATDKDGNVYAAMSSGGDGYIAVYDPQGIQLAKWEQFGDYSLYPTSITVDEAGDVYVYSRPYVLKLNIEDLALAGVAEIGNFTETNGYVTSLAADSEQGIIYAADVERESIWMLKEGEIEEWTSFALPNEDAESFDQISALALDADRRLLVVSEDGRLIKLDSEGGLLQHWEPQSSDGEENGYAFESIRDLAVSPEGFIYFIDDSYNRIIRLSGMWDEITVSDSLETNGRSVNLRSVAVAPGGGVYVTDGYGPQIIIFDAGLQWEAAWGSGGSGEGQFIEPANLTLLPDDTLLVADYGNRRVQRLDNDLQFMEQFTGAGFEPGAIIANASGDIYLQSGEYLLKQRLDSEEAPVVLSGSFGGVRDLALDAEGRLYAVDSMNYRIDRYAANGVKEESFIENMSWRPTSVVVDSVRERVYVSNGIRIMTYSLAGEQLSAQWGELEGLPYSGFDDLALDVAGNVYVVYSGESLIYKLNSEGQLLEQWGSYGTGSDQFQYAHKAVVDHKGNVFVLDRDSNRVQKFSFAGNQLQALSLSAGALDREFDSRHEQYTVEVEYEVAELSLQPLAVDGDASITVDGESVDSGAFTLPIPLTAGEEKVIEIAVTATDGQTRIYSVTVKRAEPDDGGENGGEEPGGGDDGGENGGEEPGGGDNGGENGGEEPGGGNDGGENGGEEPGGGDNGGDNGGEEPGGGDNGGDNGGEEPGGGDNGGENGGQEPGGGDNGGENGGEEPGGGDNGGENGGEEPGGGNDGGENGGEEPGGGNDGGENGGEEPGGGDNGGENGGEEPGGGDDGGENGGEEPGGGNDGGENGGEEPGGGDDGGENGGEEPGGGNDGGENGGEEPGVGQPGGGNNGGSGDAGAVTPQPVSLLDETVGGEAGRAFIRGIQVNEQADGKVRLAVGEQGVQALLAMPSVPEVIRLTLTSKTTKALELQLPLAIAELIKREPQAALELNAPFGTLRLPLKELLERAGANAQGVLVVWETGDATGKLDVSDAAGYPPAINGIEAAVEEGQPALLTEGGGWLLGLYAIGADGSRQPLAYREARAELSVKLPDKHTIASLAELTGAAYDQQGNISHAPALFKLNGEQAEVVFKLQRGGTYTVLRHNVAFADLAFAPYAAKALQALGTKFVLQGSTATAAQPLAEVTRAQFVALLARGLDAGSGQSARVVFPDVQAESWYYDPLQTAYELGWLKGYADGSMKPEQQLSRQEMAVLLYRALRSAGQAEAMSAAEVSRLLEHFADREGIAPWAREAVALAVKLGLMKGTGGDRFNPEGISNRAQSAVVVYKTMQMLQLAD